MTEVLIFYCVLIAAVGSGTLTAILAKFVYRLRLIGGIAVDLVWGLLFAHILLFGLFALVLFNRYAESQIISSIVTISLALGMAIQPWALIARILWRQTQYRE